jgi:hypothetical protein
LNIEKFRIGSFFVFIGLILLVIFFTTDQAKYPSYGYFFVGVALVFLGGFLWWRNRKPWPPAERFRAIHRMQQKRAERKAKKQQKKEQKKAGQQAAQ